MKYKLLVERGLHFVCFEDGTKIPLQIKTRVEQNARDQAFATVIAYADERMPDALKAVKKDVVEVSLHSVMEVGFHKRYLGVDNVAIISLHFGD